MKLGPLYAADDGGAGGGAAESPVDANPDAGGTPAEGGTPPEADGASPASSSDTPAGKTETPAAGTPPTQSATPKPVDWRDRRIATLTARLKEAQAQAHGQPSGGETPAPSAADIDRLANERAEALAAQRAFNDQCNAVALAGQSAYPDFQARIGQLTQLIDRNDPQSVQTYNQFLQAAIETGDAPRLLHELGGDLNEASRIMGLSPIKMGIELAKRSASAQAAASPPVSNAPKPITPVGARGQAHEPIDPSDPGKADKLSTAAWMERREKQIRERAAAQ